MGLGGGDEVGRVEDEDDFCVPNVGHSIQFAFRIRPGGLGGLGDLVQRCTRIRTMALPRVSERRRCRTPVEPFIRSGGLLRESKGGGGWVHRRASCERNGGSTCLSSTQDHIQVRFVFSVS